MNATKTKPGRTKVARHKSYRLRYEEADRMPFCLEHLDSDGGYPVCEWRFPTFPAVFKVIADLETRAERRREKGDLVFVHVDIGADVPTMHVG